MESRTLLSSSEYREDSQKSRKAPCVEIIEHEDLWEIKLPLKPKQLQQLQKNDTYCRDMAKKLHKDTKLQKIFIREEGVLYRLWIEDGRTFKCILVPQVLQDSMIILAHDYSGHNGSRRTYKLPEKTVLLARYTKTNFQTLQEMQGVCATKPRTARKVFRSF